MKTGEGEDQTCGRRKDAVEEKLSCAGIVVEMCSPGHKAHVHHGKLQVILLLTSQPGPEALQCRWPIPTSILVAHATTWFHSSEVKHLLSHGKPANTAPAQGQAAGMYTLCFQGEQ